MLDDIIENNLALLDRITVFAENHGWFVCSRACNPCNYTLEVFLTPAKREHTLSNTFSELLLKEFGCSVRIYFQSKCVSIVIDL